MLDFDSVCEKAKAGDELAWRLLIQEFGPRLSGYIWSKGISDHEDVLSEVFLALVERIKKFAGSESDFTALIFTIARRRVIDRYRSTGRQPLLVPLDEITAAHDSVNDIIETHMGSTEAMSLIKKLPPDQRDVVLLATFGQLKLSEVAAVLDKKPSAVRMLQFRARKHLKKSLKGVTL